MSSMEEYKHTIRTTDLKITIDGDLIGFDSEDYVDLRNMRLRFGNGCMSLLLF